MATKIEHHPDRLIHPYTVWFRGQIVKFCASKEEAEMELRRRREVR